MLRKIIQSTNILLLLAALSLTAWEPAQAKKMMTCPEPTPVTIDIKPGSYPNVINLSAQGLLPVAVFSTPEFNASLFSPEMVHLNDANTPMTDACSGAMAVRWVLDDVNKDGQLDLVFFFNVQDLNLTPSSTAATLMAHGSYGGTTLHIMGTDSVVVIP